jgi:iron complex transport system substrate-binding protein
MRAVSLAPSASATVAAMGGADRLVGSTTHCGVDAPAVGGWLNPVYDRVADRDPDIVLTSDDLQREIRDDLRDRGFRVAHVEPSTLDDVLASFAEIGASVGLPEAGERLEAESRERVERVRKRATEDGPMVYCEEWSDPPMAAGNWVPDVVEAAGGRYPFVAAGERSREVDGHAVEKADPDHAVVHVCGKGERVDVRKTTASSSAAHQNASRSEDADPAARWGLDADVHVVDDSLLNQPSPRLLDGLELLAATLRDD